MKMSSPPYPNNDTSESDLRSTALDESPLDTPQRMTIKPSQSPRCSTHKSKMPIPTTALDTKRPGHQDVTNEDVTKRRQMNNKVTSMEEGSSSSHSSQPKASSFVESMAKYVLTQCPNANVFFFDHIERITFNQNTNINLIHQTTAHFPQSTGIQEPQSRLSAPREVSPTSGLSRASRPTSTDYGAERASSLSRREYKERVKAKRIEKVLEWNTSQH